MRDESLTVYVVEDDSSVRDSLALMLRLSGVQSRTFADAESFVTAWRREWAGCVVTDLRLPGMSGVELQGALRALGGLLPFVVITANGDVSSARAAFLADAVDFLEKPFKEPDLHAAIAKAFTLERSRLATENLLKADEAKLQELTPREREILDYAARGLHAKEIAASLGISPRTVEVHKARIMEKLGLRNVAEMVRFAVGIKTS